MTEVLNQLRYRAQKRRARIALPETLDPRTIAAREQLEASGLMDVVWIENPEQDKRFDEVAQHVFSQRQHKGITKEEAAQLARQPLIYGAAIVALGYADCGVSGASNPTAEVIRAGLICLGTAPSTPLVSSMFLLSRDETTLSFADCGVLPDPDKNQLVHIAYATATNHKLFTGEEPRVAFLSYSTSGSAEHEMVHKMRSACASFRDAHPEISADGELQFDAAYDVDVATRKCPDSPIGGRANVFIFPDLNSGNIAYKIAERLGGFQAYGPLLQGLNRPWLDLSRGCSAEDIIGVATIASAMLP
jgi:phosphate acetyltransferase